MTRKDRTKVTSKRKEREQRGNTVEEQFATDGGGRRGGSQDYTKDGRYGGRTGKWEKDEKK